MCYNKISIEDIESYLYKLCNKYKDRVASLPTEELNEMIKLIAQKSNGHIRNALMLLDKLFLLQQDFKSTIKDAKLYYKRLLLVGLNYTEYLQKYSKEEVTNIINSTIQELSLFTMTELKMEYELFVLDVAKYIFGIDINTDFDSVLLPYRNNFKLFNIVNDKVIYNLFEDETQFKIAMFMLIKKLSMIKEN